uniref:Carboxylic ester hydrolase n=1 Tax=Acrobeloides nanus TaxID=290746 RepID=A0A914DDV4_9BILA
MSTGDNILPGNLGFWDMTAALKFVRENIRAFGGDPNKITVWGASSGGAAVSALSLSPHSRAVWPKQLVRGQIIPREEQFQYDRNRFVQFIKNYVAPEEYFGSKAKEIQEKILAFYTKEAPESADYKCWFQKYSQLISDTTMNLPQLEEAKLRAEHDWPVYFYHTEYFNNDAIKETFNGDIPVKAS